MADFVQTDDPISVIATTFDKIGTIPPANGQITIATDRGLVAFDLGGSRSFIHGIKTIDWDAERRNMEDPVENQIYFVLDTAIFWRYLSGEWEQLTHKPEEVVYIGVTLPEVGKEGVLYADRGTKSIAVWDDSEKIYDHVANYCELSYAKEADILGMFTTT